MKGIIRTAVLTALLSTAGMATVPLPSQITAATRNFSIDQRSAIAGMSAGYMFYILHYLLVEPLI